MGRARHLVDLSRLDFERLENPLDPRRILLIGGNFSREKALEVEGRISRLEQEAGDPIVLEIDSSRNESQEGSRMAADRLHEVVGSSRVGILGLVTGSCRLSAMYVLQACKYRFAVRSAVLQFHDLRRIIKLDIFRGDDLERILGEIRELLIMTHWAVESEKMEVAERYQRRFEHLPVGLVLSLMEDEVEFTAAETLRLGIIDLIVEAGPSSR